MHINKYFPFVLIYFFVNSLGLPFGLTYTTVLAPVFYVWMLYTRGKDVAWPFIAASLPFLIAQVIAGVDTASYVTSTVNLFLVYLSAQAAFTFLTRCHDPGLLFDRLLVVNFVLCLLAIPLYFSPVYNWAWSEQGFTEGIRSFRRLKLFSYEPSYYAFIFTPVFFYFFLQYLFRMNRRPGILLLAMLFLPYLLSFSIGVMAAVLIAILLTWLIWFDTLTRKRRVLNTAIYSGGLVAGLAATLLLFFRNNALFLRLGNILGGKDTSGNGRTLDAFVLADRILAKGNEYWGIGIGQVKIVGRNIIRDYYFYINDFTVAIPNAVAETLTVYGWIGLSLRFLLISFLFFYTKVWANYYRLLLFLFLFIYQFTGSYITNLAEYVGWILAFTHVFPQFDVIRVSPELAKRLRRREERS